MVAVVLGAFALPVPSAGAVPPALAEALASFRTDGPRGWSFTQTTEAAGRSRVERYDAARPEFDRWTLLLQDGREPTPDERREYREKLSRRSRGGTAPPLASQVEVASGRIVTETEERLTCRFRLKPGEQEDLTAEFLRATVVFHKPTRTIETFELVSTGPFSPAFGVRIAAMRTVLHYSLPGADRPSLLQKTTTRLRGRAFWLKSLDADMTVTFTDYEKAGRR